MKNIYQDVNELRKNLNWQNIPLYDEELTFYYDETGNCGKLYLTEDGVNNKEALIKDFILGGVLLKGHNTQVDTQSLFDKLKIQSTELKYGKIKRNKDFDKVITWKNTSLILDWFLEYDVYIHWILMNNFYYGLCDIVDSLIGNDSILNFFNFGLKSALYYFCKENQQDCLALLQKYKYPNIQDKDIKAFCMDFSSFLQKGNTNIHLVIIQSLFEKAKDNNELVFIQNNEDNVLVDQYFHLYQGRCYQYVNSFHHFDKELEVERKLIENPLYRNDELFCNFDFVDSRQEKLIQLSDFFVGLLSDLFTYLDSITLEELFQLDYYENKVKFDNIAKIAELVIRSDKLHKMLINNISDHENVEKRFEKLYFFTNIKSFML